jgi:hypothetical protein
MLACERQGIGEVANDTLTPHQQPAHWTRITDAQAELPAVALGGAKVRQIWAMPFARVMYGHSPATGRIQHTRGWLDGTAQRSEIVAKGTAEPARFEEVGCISGCGVEHANGVPDPYLPR